MSEEEPSVVMRYLCQALQKKVVIILRKERLLCHNVYFYDFSI